MLPNLTHIALHVRVLDACADFYQKFCGLTLVHERGEDDKRVIWLAERGREEEFVLVLISGGLGRDQSARDYSHLGFALSDRAAVDAIAERAEAASCLIWPPRQDDYPVGYYCGVRDPDGNVVEFSFGQPLGPGAKSF